MTKVQAIEKVLQDFNGSASWKIIYDNIEKYYPNIKEGNKWQEGIRGVLYREIKNKRLFKKTGIGIFSLIDFDENQEVKEIKQDKIRMHSYIEGICIELGNFDKFKTYTADPSAKFSNKIQLSSITTLNAFPQFTYEDIVKIIKRIDVLWFNPKGLLFPKRAFEIVDSVGTLGEAFNRMYQLSQFNLDFYIIGQEKNRNKFEQKRNIEPYIKEKDRFIYKSYDEIISFYNKRVEVENMNFFK